MNFYFARLSSEDIMEELFPIQQHNVSLHLLNSNSRRFRVVFEHAGQLDWLCEQSEVDVVSSWKADPAAFQEYVNETITLLQEVGALQDATPTQLVREYAEFVPVRPGIAESVACRIEDQRRKIWEDDAVYMLRWPVAAQRVAVSKRLIDEGTAFSFFKSCYPDDLWDTVDALEAIYPAFIELFCEAVSLSKRDRFFATNRVSNSFLATYSKPVKKNWPQIEAHWVRHLDVLHTRLMLFVSENEDCLVSDS